MDGRQARRRKNVTSVSFWGDEAAKGGREKKGLNRIMEVMKKFRRIMMMILKYIIYIYIYYFFERRLKIWSKWERHGHEQHGVLYLLWMSLQSREQV